MMSTAGKKPGPMHFMLPRKLKPTMEKEEQLQHDVQCPLQ